MSIFSTADEESLKLGYIIGLSCDLVQAKYKSKVHPTVVDQITRQLKEKQRNYFPVIVFEVEEEQYEAVENIHILEAAKRANMDFVWCMIVDENINRQVSIEKGELNRTLLKVQINSASEIEIKNALSYLKENKLTSHHIMPEKAAKAIIERRSNEAIKSLEDLRFLKEIKCGVGSATLNKIQQIVSLE
ncbi:MAG: hypothetical protein RI580_07140 [Halothece sp. Uz-M2-17]|nr:hypothetical protein [Halothece sp. Uz-M2-17]